MNKTSCALSEVDTSWELIDLPADIFDRLADILADALVEDLKLYPGLGGEFRDEVESQVAVGGKL